MKVIEGSGEDIGRTVGFIHNATQQRQDYVACHLS